MKYKKNSFELCVLRPYQVSSFVDIRVCEEKVVFAICSTMFIQLLKFVRRAGSTHSIQDRNRERAITCRIPAKGGQATSPEPSSIPTRPSQTSHLVLTDGRFFGSIAALPR